MSEYPQQALLIEQLKQGNEQAFQHLVNHYQKMVFRTCLAIVHNQMDADDIAQEVYIEAFNSIHKFRSDAKISTWLYRIAVNKSLNHLRSNKRKNFFQATGLAQMFEVADSSNNSDQAFEDIQQQQRKKILDAALDSLPENQRTAFVLHKIETLAYKEIAEIMNVSLASVESLIFRAKQNLQKKLLHCYKKSC